MLSRVNRRTWIIVSAAFVKTGGQDRANYALARHLASRGEDVHLVTHQVSDGLQQRPNVTVHRVPMPLRSTFLGEAFLRGVGRRLATAAPDACVVANGGNFNWQGVNWVHYVHSAYERESRGLLRRAMKRAAHRRYIEGEKRALRAARLVIANSHRTKRDLVGRLGISDDRARVIYYGIDTEVFHHPLPGEREATRATLGWPGTRPLVLFVGELGDRRKGFDTLYQAWRALCESDAWDAELIVIGRGAELSAWKARVAKAGLAARVRFLGFRDDVPAIMRACDVLVSPTRYEAYGLAIHEALCCGLPSIASAEAGVAERFPAELRELLLSNPDDASDLATRLKICIDLPARSRQALNTFSQQLSARSWEDMAAEIVKATEEGDSLQPPRQ